uniref:Protein HGH1 homolog n=1 Tax=Calcidiscus leptoporus TaxID=127549 RepID=A0A7S0ITF7_9EUKA|mmetsp:Transcript_2207/g.4954  ORF Transcript_2207/g.4954 Transcript_2207/m.4954 type:complete len:353 (+) Transcript_2207:106-1164(+)
MEAERVPADRAEAISVLARWLSLLAKMPVGLPTPPAPLAVNALKALRALCEQGDAVLLDSLSIADNARTLYGVVALASANIDAIDADVNADTASAGLLLWGHARKNALACLVCIASNEARCKRLVLCNTDTVEGPGVGSSPGPSVCGCCVDILHSRASRADMEGLRLSTNLLRNVSMPAANRAAVGAVGGAITGLLEQVSHKEPNVAALVAATLRLLVQGCDLNATRAASVPSVFGRILDLDMTRLHPHARAELARFICLTIAHADASSLNESVLDMRALRFGAFLLGSKYPELHREAVSALRVARNRMDCGWIGDGITVPVAGSETLLPQVLRALVDAGSLSAAECEGLLA